MTDELNDLAERFRRVESSIKDSPLIQRTSYEYDPRVPAVEHVDLASGTSSGGVTQVVITFIRPFAPNIDKFEIWVNAYGSNQPTLIATVKDSPAAFSLSTAPGTVVVAYIRTVLLNGLTSALNASPTVTFTA
jgi:hypothetical protein